MDEWTGTVDTKQTNALLDVFRFALPGVLEELGRYPDAVAMLNRFLEREPDAADVRQHMVELQNRLRTGAERD